MNHRLFIVIGLTIVATTLWSSKPFSTANLLPSAPPADEIYPRPTAMAAPTSKSLGALLAVYESVLLEISPEVHASLQSGLTKQEMDELQQQYEITLSDDVRTLYAWKNGSDPSNRIDAFPYMRFVPLKDALKARDHFLNSSKQKSPELREVYDSWLSFRYSWIGVLENGAGDGYYYDPARRTETSSFFYTCHDDVGYMFYPSLGNFIEQLLELHRRKMLSADKSGIAQDSDWAYGEEKLFLNKFGQWVL